MSTTVVIPTTNGAGRIADAIGSIDGADQLIVVDNDSRDGTRELLSRRFPDVDVLALPRNEGFAAAVNRAARVARHETLVLLNDDCVCEPGFVPTLAAALAPATSVVMAAGVLTEPGTATIDSAGIELDETLLVFDYLNGEPLARAFDAPAPIGPCGAAAAFDRAAYLDAGGFDERFFAYWEDVDLALRLRAIGGVCRLAPTARARHAHSATLGSGSREKNYLTGFGRGYMLRTWGVARGRRIAAVAVRDSAICLGQLVIDRTGAGIRGRVEGWRAAGDRPRRAYPELGLGETGVGSELLRRFRRRRRLARAAAARGR
jgi:GT2 family glycosyltransferase